LLEALLVDTIVAQNPMTLPTIAVEGVVGDSAWRNGEVDRIAGKKLVGYCFE
jgi:hypothetical protein